MPERVKPALAKLLTRAGMDIYQFNTGVIRNTDVANRDFRLGVTTGNDPAWRDCVAVSVSLNSNTFWNIGHFSPARARLLAAHLIRCAITIEKAEGRKKIDHEPRKRK